MKLHKFREVIQKLTAHSSDFQFYKAPGGGSHRQIWHPNIDGRPQSYPLPFHGANRDVKRPYLKGIINRFRLPKDFFD